MSNQEIGDFINRLRKSRGMTLEQLAEAAGVSISTVKKLRRAGSDLNMTHGSLDAVLTALAIRARLGGSEIQRLVQLTGRKFETFDLLNDRADELHQHSERRKTVSSTRRREVRERIEHAIDTLIVANQGETILVQLEALASLYAEQVGTELREPAPKRQLRVIHPERRVKDMVITDISNYDIEDDEPPRAKQPLRDPDTRPREHGSPDSDTMDNTG